jgi:hypothetical protein
MSANIEKVWQSRKEKHNHLPPRNDAKQFFMLLSGKVSNDGIVKKTL